MRGSRPRAEADPVAVLMVDFPVSAAAILKVGIRCRLVPAEYVMPCWVVLAGSKEWENGSTIPESTRPFLGIVQF